MKAMFENHGGIYQVKNLINNKIYIGQASNLRIRKNKHLGDLRRGKHGNPHLQRAYNMYGKENFTFDIILYCEPDELTYYEQMLVDIWQPEYNIRKKCVNSNFGIKFSEETRRKNSEGHKGLKRSEECKKEMSLARRGENHYNFGGHRSEETKKKLSEANKGKSTSNELREKRRKIMLARDQKGEKNPMFGKRPSDEGIDQRSRKLAGKKKKKNTSSQYVGVFYNTSRKRWVGRIQYKNKSYSKYCHTEIEAAIFYNEKALELYGPNAKLNIIEEKEE
jgi:group I intron endonuclease